jgi:hypothetical protein
MSLIPSGRPPTTVAKNEHSPLECLGGNGGQAHQRRDREDVRLQQERRPVPIPAMRNGLWRGRVGCTGDVSA